MFHSAPWQGLFIALSSPIPSVSSPLAFPSVHLMEHEQKGNFLSTWVSLPLAHNLHPFALSLVPGLFPAMVKIAETRFFLFSFR